MMLLHYSTQGCCRLYMIFVGKNKNQKDRAKDLDSELEEH